MKSSAPERPREAVAVRRQEQLATRGAPLTPWDRPLRQSQISEKYGNQRAVLVQGALEAGATAVVRTIPELLEYLKILKSQPYSRQVKSMIRGICVLSAKPETPSELAATLDRIGIAHGWGKVGSNESVTEGDSTIWVYPLSLEEAGYEPARQMEIEKLLGGALRHLLQIEFDDGTHSMEMVVALVLGLPQAWPVIFDNGISVFLAPDRMGELAAGLDF
jgi:hypothetical protein